MRQEGRTIKQIAAQLNAEGYRTPRSRKGYMSTSVRKLLSRGELTRGRIATRQLDRHEWWLPDLAHELQMSTNKLRDWALRGWVRSRQVPPRGLWVIWADREERQRLRKLRAQGQRVSKSCASLGLRIRAHQNRAKLHALTTSAVGIRLRATKA
jgi:hypothetical protein